MALRSVLLVAVTALVFAAHPAVAKRAWPFPITYPAGHAIGDSDIASIVSAVSHRKEGSHRIVRVQFQSPVEAQVFIKDGELLTVRKRHERWLIDPWVVGTWAI